MKIGCLRRVCSREVSISCSSEYVKPLPGYVVCFDWGTLLGVIIRVKSLL